MNTVPEPHSEQSFRKSDFFPDGLQCIGLIAPAGRISPERYRAACRFLTGLGIRVVSGKSVLKGDVLGYLSAPAEDRAADFNSLVRNPEVQALYCLRGGYGSVHLLHLLDWETLKRRRLPLIGYSDITALHAAMTLKHAGIAISACMALNLKDDSAPAVFRQNFKRAWAMAWNSGGRFRRFAGLHSYSDYDSASGPLFCGNLTTLASLCGTGFLPKMKGKTVFLEDIGEPVRKLDRTLMQLKLNGFFDGCAGVVFGNFLQCGSRVGREELFRRFAAEISAPVFSGLHYGHCSHSISLVCGEKAEIRNGSLYLRDLLTA